MRKVLVISFIAGMAGIVVLFAWQGIYVPKEARVDEQRLFSIERGESVFEVGKHLKKQGFIRSWAFFVLYVIGTGGQADLKAGEYLLSSGMSTKEIIERLVRGEKAFATIRIREGWNIGDIAEYLEEQKVINADEFFKAVGFPPFSQKENRSFTSQKDWAFQFDFLGELPEGSTLEGYLFPDTYKAELETSREDTVEMMLQNFAKKLAPEIREEIKKQGKTIFEVVTMASLLEKEVKRKEEKELVAGILWKRLEHGIPLQVDATILYITGNQDGEIFKQDLQIDSPYNTRRYRGLPPGPISNPGLESILAAVHPKQSKYWYYLSTPEGETLFSKTLAEHNQKKAKYLSD
ncbi:MAG: endolytic transglycosylase MltG [Patescibacteria group bacterium]